MNIIGYIHSTGSGTIWLHCQKNVMEGTSILSTDKDVNSYYIKLSFNGQTDLPNIDNVVGYTNIPNTTFSIKKINGDNSKLYICTNNNTLYRFIVDENISYAGFNFSKSPIKIFRNENKYVELDESTVELSKNIEYIGNDFINLNGNNKIIKILKQPYQQNKIDIELLDNNRGLYSNVSLYILNDESSYSIKAIADIVQLKLSSYNDLFDLYEDESAWYFNISKCWSSVFVSVKGTMLNIYNNHFSYISELPSNLSEIEIEYNNLSKVFEERPNSFISKGNLYYNNEKNILQYYNGSEWETIATSENYKQINHGTSDTYYELTPNIFHVWDEVTELNLYFGLPIPEIANEYIFQFTSGSTATDLIISGNVKWSTQPDIKPNKIYQISILNGMGTILEFDL